MGRNSKLVKELTINEDLKSVLPPLSKEEHEGLEASIKKNGCLMPLIVWGDIIIDGHNRYEICIKHGIPFNVQLIEFDSLDEAKIWIFENQNDQRNLTPYQRAEIVLELKPIFAAQAKERQGKRTDLLGTNIPTTLSECGDTRTLLARKARMSEGNLDKVKHIIEHADEVMKEKLRQGSVSINRVYKHIKEANQQQYATESDDEVADQGYNDDAETGQGYFVGNNPIIQPKPKRANKLPKAPDVVEQKEPTICFENVENIQDVESIRVEYRNALMTLTNVAMGWLYFTSDPNYDGTEHVKDVLNIITDNLDALQRTLEEFAEEREKGLESDESESMEDIFCDDYDDDDYDDALDADVNVTCP